MSKIINLNPRICLCLLICFFSTSSYGQVIDCAFGPPDSVPDKFFNVCFDYQEDELTKVRSLNSIYIKSDKDFDYPDLPFPYFTNIPPYWAIFWEFGNGKYEKYVLKKPKRTPGSTARTPLDPEIPGSRISNPFKLNGEYNIILRAVPIKSSGDESPDKRRIPEERIKISGKRFQHADRIPNTPGMDLPTNFDGDDDRYLKIDSHWPAIREGDVLTAVVAYRIKPQDAFDVAKGTIRVEMPEKVVLNPDNIRFYSLNTNKTKELSNFEINTKEINGEEFTESVEWEVDLIPGEEHAVFFDCKPKAQSISEERGPELLSLDPIKVARGQERIISIPGGDPNADPLTFELGDVPDNPEIKIKIYDKSRGLVSILAQEIGTFDFEIILKSTNREKEEETTTESYRIIVQNEDLDGAEIPNTEEFGINVSNIPPIRFTATLEWTELEIRSRNFNYNTSRFLRGQSFSADGIDRVPIVAGDLKKAEERPTNEIIAQFFSNYDGNLWGFVTSDRYTEGNTLKDTISLDIGLNAARDPNIMTVEPYEIEPGDRSHTLTYKINFTNEGSASAEMIKVVPKLNDEFINWNSLRDVNFSPRMVQDASFCFSQRGLGSQENIIQRANPLPSTNRCLEEFDRENLSCIHCRFSENPNFHFDNRNKIDWLFSTEYTSKNVLLKPIAFIDESEFPTTGWIEFKVDTKKRNFQVGDEIISSADIFMNSDFAQPEQNAVVKVKKPNIILKDWGSGFGIKGGIDFSGPQGNVFPSLSNIDGWNAGLTYRFSNKRNLRDEFRLINSYVGPSPFTDLSIFYQVELLINQNKLINPRSDVFSTPNTFSNWYLELPIQTRFVPNFGRRRWVALSLGISPTYFLSSNLQNGSNEIPVNFENRNQRFHLSNTVDLAFGDILFKNGLSGGIRYINYFTDRKTFKLNNYKMLQLYLHFNL